jgi:hypothetical protein
MHDSVTPGPDEATLRGEATGVSAFRGSLVEDAESTEAGHLSMAAARASVSAVTPLNRAVVRYAPHLSSSELALLAARRTAAHHSKLLVVVTDRSLTTWLARATARLGVPEAGMLTSHLLAKRPGAAAGGVLLAASDDPFEGSRTEQVVIAAVRDDGHVVGRGSGQLNDPTQSAIARIAATAAEGPMFTTEQMGAWFEAARSR